MNILRRKVFFGGMTLASVGVSLATNSPAAATHDSTLTGVLSAAGPHPNLGSHADTYGRFIGAWRGTYEIFKPEGTLKGAIGVSFGWILDGRAVQDCGWELEGMKQGEDGRGSTLRMYDPAIDAWRIIWFDPVHHICSEMVGRRVGNDVVQQGYQHDRAIRWTFTDVTSDSFVWQGYHLADDGKTWVLEDEYRFRRVT